MPPWVTNPERALTDQQILLGAHQKLDWLICVSTRVFHPLRGMVKAWLICQVKRYDHH